MAIFEYVFQIWKWLTWVGVDDAASVNGSLTSASEEALSAPQHGRIRPVMDLF